MPKHWQEIFDKSQPRFRDFMVKIKLMEHEVADRLYNKKAPQRAGLLLSVLRRFPLVEVAKQRRTTRIDPIQMTRDGVHMVCGGCEIARE